MFISVKLLTKYVIIYLCIRFGHFLLVRYMKSSASESKPFQSRSKGEIPARARRKERLSRSRLKQAFLIYSDTELFIKLNSMY